MQPFTRLHRAINPLKQHASTLATSEIIEDKARKLVTTPAYMLAQNISEAASGINKLVDRVLELTHENDV